MKFFSASLFLLLGSAILSGSFATPAHKSQLLGGLNLDGVLGVDVLLSNVLESAEGLLDKVSELVLNILNKLPELLPEVLSAVQQLISETGKVLTCTVSDVVNNLLCFITEVGGCSITINVDPNTLQVFIQNILIGTLEEDGSICNLDGVIIGCIDPLTGVLVLAGGVVDEVLGSVDDLLCNVNGLLNNVLQSADKLVHGLNEALQTALSNLSEELRDALCELPKVTDNVLSIVNGLINKVGQVLVCTLDEVVGRVLKFTGEVSGEGDVTICVDLDSLKVTVNGRLIGTLCEDGSIQTALGKIIGFIDSETGVLCIAGNAVKTVLQVVIGLVGGLLGGLLG